MRVRLAIARMIKAYTKLPNFYLHTKIEELVEQENIQLTDKQLEILYKDFHNV